MNSKHKTMSTKAEQNQTNARPAPPAIFAAICGIMSEVEAIGKNKKNQQQGYAFRGIDDMYNALQPLFKKNGVFITSNVLESKREERATRNGGVLIYTIAKCQFRFYAVDGSYIETTLEGEAMDSADKATNKAMSTALKYALMQMFLIPTEEKLDTENETPDVALKQKATPPPPKKEEIKQAVANDLKEIVEQNPEESLDMQQWREVIIGCKTEAELLHVYKQNESAINANPKIKVLFTAHKNQLRQNGNVAA